MSGLAVEIVPNSNATIVTVQGAADVSGSAELDRKLTMLSAQRPRMVIFDLSRMSFISSLCMGSLIQFGHGMIKRGSKVAVAAAQPTVAEALKRIRLEAILPMYASVEDAVAASQAAAPNC